MNKSLLVAALVAVSLTACATSQPAPIAATARGSVTGVATAALFGTYEMEVAPIYTRMVVLRSRTARQAEAHRISDDTAIEIMVLTDMARRQIDTARRGSQSEPTLLQRAALAEAIRLLDRVDSLLEK